MKRMLLVLAAVLLAAAPATALEQGLQEGHAAIGVMLPLGDFGDGVDTGFLFGAGYGYWITPRIQLGAQFDYAMFSYSDLDVDGNIFSYRAFGKYALMMEDSTPYIKVLLGFYSLGSDDIVIDGVTFESETDTEFGFGIGLGYQHRGASNIGFFGEGVYNKVDDSSFLNVRAGISLYWGGRTGYASTGTRY